MDILTALEKLFDRFGRAYNKGDVLFKENEEGSDMFFILEGSVDVKKKTIQDGNEVEVKLATLKQPDFFGEMSLLNNEKRSATIEVSKDNTRIIRISHGNFDTIVKLQPQIALNMLSVITNRLRATSQKLAEMQKTTK